MRLLQILILSILLMSSQVQAQEQPEPVVNWISFEQLGDTLDSNPKPVLIFFHTEWCSYCKKMLRETFRNKEVIEKLNSEYYAVEFDAESIDSVFFDGVIYTNSSSRKRTGNYHELFKILMGGSDKHVFPITLVMNADFSVKMKKINYLSIKQILNIL